MMFVSIIYSMPFCMIRSLILSLSVVNHGLGRHVWVGPPDANEAWAKGLFISEVSYTCVICSVKFSLLAFYWRLFKQSKIRIPIYVLGAVVTCWGIAVVSLGSLYHERTPPFDASLDSYHNLPVSARERILDAVCADAAYTGKLHVRRQRQRVLRWKFNPEYHHRCGTSHPAYAIHMATASPQSPKARAE